VPPVWKLLKIDGRNPTVLENALKKAVETHFKKYGSGYVGIAVDPAVRFAQHNRKVAKMHGESEKWPHCFVIYEVNRYERVRKLEAVLTNVAEVRYGANRWNKVKGGGGRPPKFSKAKGYIYLLLDERETTWS
jgi:hypothetical protein